MSDILKEIDDMFNDLRKDVDKRTLGEKLQERRSSLSLKMTDIARISGLSESLIGRIESDKIDDIKISTMKKLSMAYDVSPNLFIMHLGVDDEIRGISSKAAEITNARKLLSKK